MKNLFEYIKRTEERILIQVRVERSVAERARAILKSKGLKFSDIITAALKLVVEEGEKNEPR